VNLGSAMGTSRDLYQDEEGLKASVRLALDLSHSVQSLAASPHDRYVCIQSINAVHVWYMVARSAGTGFENAVNCLVWAPNGDCFVGGGLTDAVHIWLMAGQVRGTCVCDVRRLCACV
jgi:hypothetical protein